ncbi:MAG: hypothetical protein GY737_03100 [Desulfobacteraceae bacterium]|nr:hypothetical protein [Desulfobacteraceae bacterium]
MQQKKKTVQEQLVLMVAGILWVTGLLLAGSDNPYMPWTNLGGLALFYGASVMMARRFEMSGQHSLEEAAAMKPSPLCSAGASDNGSASLNGRACIRGSASGSHIPRGSRGRYTLKHAMAVLLRG